MIADPRDRPLLHGTSVTTLHVGAGPAQTLGGTDAIAGDGDLTKSGPGTLVLAGSHSYSGETLVAAGTLRFTGTSPTSPVTVASGATLDGTGTVGAVQAQAGAIIAPGLSLGTLTVASFGWHGGATAMFELGSPGTSDLLAVTGAFLKASGSLFRFDFQGSGQVGTYTLVTFASTTFTAADFSYTNLAPCLRGAFALVGSTLQLTVEPLPISTRHTFTSGDCRADLLWRETSAGLTAVWRMSGATITGIDLLPSADPSWAAIAVGDFDGDGEADVLWRHATTNQVALWLMHGTAVATYALVATVPSPWTIAGVGDFDGDGRTDLLWRHATTRQVVLWLMHGATIVAQSVLGTVTAAWTVVGVADFDHDGTADILWRDGATGHVALWLTTGTALVGTVPVAAWPTALVRDFNGDGHADILWRNTATNEVAIWLMNGPTIGTMGLVPNIAPAWVPR